jgi:hypothetical protein
MHPSSSLWLMAFPLTGLVWTMAATRKTIDVGAVVDQARHDAKLSHEQCWLDMGYRSGSSWSRALKGEPGYSLDLWRMAQLEPIFWWHFFALFGLAMFRHWKQQQLQQLGGWNGRSRNIGRCDDRDAVQPVVVGVRREPDPLRVDERERQSGRVDVGGRDGAGGVRRVG